MSTESTPPISTKTAIIKIVMMIFAGAVNEINVSRKELENAFITVHKADKNTKLVPIPLSILHIIFVTIFAAYFKR